jgi:hypothetical protein
MKYYQVQVQFTLDEGKKQKLAYFVLLLRLTKVDFPFK